MEFTTALSRIAVGFAALCLVKLILLVSLRKQLFEIHWRVSDEAPNWVNSAAFYLFAVLVGLNLWKLGTRCLPAGARVVRAANICVLFLCALFIFLTFHAGDKNYLYAVMTDILSWKSLGWYLYNDSCYQMPFLAAWVFAYALAYYGFWSKGREHLMLRVTAVFATAYILLCLRDFREYRNVLVIADCLGIACLVLNGAGALNPFWMVLPLVGAGSLFILFRPFQSGLALGNLNAEFSVLLWGCLILFTGVTLIAWRRGFLAGWWRILPFVIASFLLVNTNYPAYPNLENLLCMGFMLPRYFLGEFGIMAALFVVAFLYRKFRPTGTLLWLDAINLLLITIALADLRLTQIMSVRLDYDVISLAAGETTKMMWRMSQPYLPSLALGVLVITAFYALSLWAIRRIQAACSLRFSDSLAPIGGEGRGEGVVSIYKGALATNGSLLFAIVACLLLGIAGIHFAPGDKAEGQTLVRFAQTSPLLKRSTTPVLDRATFCKNVPRTLAWPIMCAPTASTSAHPARP